MSTRPSMFAIAVAIGMLLLVTIQNAQAALPCNLHPIIHSTEFSDQPTEEPIAQPLVQALMGVRPADRNGATVIDYDTPRAMRFRVVSAGENILRCLDYGQSEALAINATPGYRFSQFGLGNDIPEGVNLISDLDASSVYTERVQNPMQLANGLYLVDFTARHHDIWLTGEMVFELYDDDELYLSGTYLHEINPDSGESHTVVTDMDGPSAERLTVRDGDVIIFRNERDESIRIVITTDDTGDEVFRGGNLGKNFAGPAPKSAFYVSELDPGTYTATITSDGGDVFTISITLEP